MTHSAAPAAAITPATTLDQDVRAAFTPVSRIAANAAPHAMRDAFDIGEALYALAHGGEPVTVYAGERAPSMARIASVDPELPHFVLDFGDSAPPAPGPATFVAIIKGDARLQFDLDGAWDTLPGQPRLVQAVFPEVCLVLDRRVARRIATPLGGNYSASFGFGGKQYDLPLFDFSQGGIGMRATPEQCAELTVGKKLTGVRVELGPALVIVADLEIRLLRPFRSFLMGEQVQIGCSFASMSMQMQQKLDQRAHAGQGAHGAVCA